MPKMVPRDRLRKALYSSELADNLGHFPAPESKGLHGVVPNLEGRKMAKCKMYEIPRESRLLVIAHPESAGDNPLTDWEEAFIAVHAEMERLQDALQSAMGFVDTPIGRRKLGIDANSEWLREARDMLPNRAAKPPSNEEQNRRTGSSLMGM